MTCGERRGTDAGAVRHRRAGEKPCDDCRAGSAAYQRRRRRGELSADNDNQSGRSIKVRHGTVAGHHRHRRAGEQPCEKCRKAWNQYQLRWYRRRCGTEGGFHRHRRAGEEPCDACRRAANRAARRRSRRQRIEPGAPPAGECGTEAGYGRHRRAGEQPCDACMAARRNAARRRRRIRNGQDPDAPLQQVRVRQGCGTRAGATWHRRAGEPLCVACLEADREAGRLWRRRKRLDEQIDRLLNGGWEGRKIPARVLESIAAYPVFDRSNGCGTPGGVDLGCGCRACRTAGRKAGR